MFPADRTLPTITPRSHPKRPITKPGFADEVILGTSLVLNWLVYLELLPGRLGLEQSSIDFPMAEIAKAVAIFLGVPLVAGYLTRRWGEARRGREWYESQFLPRIGPVALWGLLFTVVLLFALQGEKITNEPLDVARIALPLVPISP